MSDKIYINEEFKKNLQELGCGLSEDYISVYKTEGDKVFFKYGKCKLHLTKKEVDEVKLGE